ncbi:unnamed protein product [Symbiodinium sp. CCMP2592]|nr:unnamed protein product [Symbiodinium sp. CCMP2592]
MVAKLIKRGPRCAQHSLSWSSVRMHGQLVQSNQVKDQQLAVVGDTVLRYVLLTLPTPPLWSWHEFRPLPAKKLGFRQLPEHAVLLALKCCSTKTALLAQRRICPSAWFFEDSADTALCNHFKFHVKVLRQSVNEDIALKLQLLGIIIEQVPRARLFCRSLEAAQVLGRVCDQDSCSIVSE